MRYPKAKKRKKLSEIIREHYGKGLPFVMYKRPGGTRITAHLQSDASLQTGMDLTRPGFLMVPFDPEGSSPVYLRADRSFQAPYKGPMPGKEAGMPPSDPVGKEIHLDLVRKSIEAIREGTMSKVVASRRFSVPGPKDIFRTYFDMIRIYPEAFGYLWHHPEAGTWIGATPELLLRYHSGRSRTLALAGTRKVDPEASPPEWTKKERHEQQLVTDYIVDRMKKLSLHPETGAVRDIRAGSLWHLGTEITAPATQTEASELLHSLHPTPAVCGTPLEAAKAFIKMNENYSREYYTGFLGEVGGEQDGGF